jgi:hypothetical protein
MIIFENGIDIRAREVATPTVAKLGERFIVIGTDYGHIHTSGGDIRTWASYSGARRFAKQYSKDRV